MKALKAILTAMLVLVTVTACSLIASANDEGSSIDSLTISTAELVLKAGDMGQVTVTISPADSQKSAGVSWEYDHDMLYVEGDNYGAVVTGLIEGQTMLRVIAEGKSKSCVVTVTAGNSAPTARYPYVYASADYLSVAPGKTVQVSASLFSGLPTDINGYTFTIDKPSVASLSIEGNYCWITGLAEGVARLSVRHSKASYPYTILVSCSPDNRTTPYITTANNIKTINRSLEDEAAFFVDIENPKTVSFENEGRFAYTIVDSNGTALASPPISIAANGRQCILRPLSTGECFIRVTHPDALYGLDVLVRVVENSDIAYISASESVLQVRGATSSTLSVSMVNLSPNSEATPDFTWSFPDNAEDYIDYTVFGGSTAGSGNSLWVTGKKQGLIRVTVSHPLAAFPKEIAILVRDIDSQAARASTFISTSQNYVETALGADDTYVSIYINNAAPGKENQLSWAILNDAADGSSDPVISYVGGTGTATSSSVRSALQVASGFALIHPLKAGTAVITISHPDAVYDTKILVAVKDASSAKAAYKYHLSASDAFYSALIGTAIEIEVSLNSTNATPADYANLSWHTDSSLLTLSAAGSTASITATGTGKSKEVITVTHPEAEHPLTIYIIRYETEADLASIKALYAQQIYYTLYTGAASSLQTNIINGTLSDHIAWEVLEGNNTIITFTESTNLTPTITAVAKGTAKIRATLAGTDERIDFFVTVKQSGAVNEDLPCYLTTTNNVLVLDRNGQGAVSVVPVNISSYYYRDLVWTNANPDIASVSANNETADIIAGNTAGTATITVSHPLASNTLNLYIHVGSEFVHRNDDIPYISTTADTLTVRQGEEDTVFTVVLAHTASSALDTTGFSFTMGNTSVATVSFSTGSNTCFIHPVSPGQTKLTVTHPQALYPKEVLIIVDRAASDTGGIPYITTEQNVVTVIAGEYVNVNAAIAGVTATGGTWAWATDNNNTASVVMNSGPTAMIYGDTPGTTMLTITNSLCTYSLRLVVICLDAGLARQQPWIKTNANIVNLKLGGTAPISAEMVGGTESDKAAFLWSSTDSSTILLTGSGGSASVKGLKAGMTSVAVRNSKYPESYVKTVLVIVEDTVEDDVYITVSQNIVKMRPEERNNSTITATLVGGTALDAKDFIWWADDYNIVSFASTGATANVQPTGVHGSTTVHAKHPKAFQVVDIIVMVSAFETFKFETQSVSIPQGTVRFIPVEVPVTAEKTTVAYESLNTNVSVVTGSNAVCMIAAVNPGSTSVRATLQSDLGPISTADISIIVTPVDANINMLSTSSSIHNMEIGMSDTLQAEITGADILPTDKFDIQWTSSDPTVLELLATETGATKGNFVYATAKRAGEVVLTAQHPKCASPLQIWVIIPPKAALSIRLDQTYVQLNKEDGSLALTATLLGGKAADYNTIMWTAPKMSGQIIISLTKSKGKTCNIIPRNSGMTTLRAQLPNGLYADCIVSVTTSAEITFETLAVHINPGYSQTIHYTISPENAQVSFVAVGGSGQNVAQTFTYSSNDAARTLTIYGVSLGQGVITAYFVGANGGKRVSINVYIEYTYEFNLGTNGVITREPREANIITIPFTVYPPDMTMGAVISDPAKLELMSISLDPKTGVGTYKFKPLGEKKGLYVDLTATQPKDTVNTPLRRRQYIDLYYTNLSITPVFDFDAGAFSNYSGSTLYLGDGEDSVFHLEVSEKNATLSNLVVSWQSVNGATKDNSTGNDNYIALTQNESVNQDGEALHRIRHTNDYTDQNYYLLNKDLVFEYWTDGDSTVPVVSPHTLVTDTDYPSNRAISQWYTRSSSNDGLFGWGSKADVYLKCHAFDPFLDHLFTTFNRIVYGYSGDPDEIRTVINFSSDYDGTEKEISVNDDMIPNYLYNTSSRVLTTKNHLKVWYRPLAKNVLLSETRFKNNPNYYRANFTASSSAGGWFGSADASADWPETKLHQYATPAPSIDTSVVSTTYGQLKLSYTRFDSTPEQKIINVQVQRRNCTNYARTTSSAWRQVAPGRWEEQ